MQIQAEQAQSPAGESQQAEVKVQAALYDSHTRTRTVNAYGLELVLPAVEVVVLIDKHLVLEVCRPLLVILIYLDYDYVPVQDVR
jgi:hypothetical protein